MIGALSHEAGHQRALPTGSKHPTTALAAALIAWAALSATPAFAAAATVAATSSSGEPQLEEVVVTAEKRESTVQETPISMTALSGDQLATQGIASVEDLADTVPGIAMRTSGPGQTEYEMRGLASGGGAVATVGFYLDETPLSASAVALNGRTVIDPDLFDLNHVEVLRGPQGTLYGAGSMGGTIKLVTNQPKLGTFEGAASVDASKTDGGGDNGGGNLMLNVPLGGIAALRVVLTDKYVSGWIDRDVVSPFPFPTNPSSTTGLCANYFCTRGDVAAGPFSKIVHNSNQERFVSARPTLLVKPTDQLSITATLMYQRIDADGYNEYQAPPGPLGSYTSNGLYNIYQPYDIKEPYYDEFKLASLKIVYDLPFAQLTSATSYWKRFVIQSQDSTEPLQNIFNLTAFVPTLFQENDTTTQLAEELRLTSTGEGPFQWVGGLYAADLHSGYLTNQAAVGFATAMGCPLPFSGGNCPPGDSYNINIGGQAANPQGLIFVDDNPNITKQYAVFGEASYKVTPSLKVTTGVRFYKFDVQNHSHQCGVGTGTGNATCQVGSASGSGTNVLPKLNVSYEPTPDFTAYGTISKGSRPGGVNLPIPLPTPQQLQQNPGAYNCGPGSGPVFVTSQPSFYGPDSIWSYELGEKSRFDDRRFSVNADVYYVRWLNIQQYITLSCGYPYNGNLGQARAYGPELEFSARLWSGLTFDANGAYTQAYLNAPNAASPYTPGTRILNVPKYTYTLALDYEQPLAGDFNLTARLSDAYVGPVDDAAYYRVTLPGYKLIDFKAGLGKGPWAVYLVAHNLSNTRAQLTIDNTTFAWQQPTITRVSTNQPRTIGFEARYRF